MESGLNLKLKKALAEMLFLAILNEMPRPILEVAELLDQKSMGICKMQFPYAIVYRMQESGYIVEAGSRMTPERKRTFYTVTSEGKAYLEILKKEYKAFVLGVENIFGYLSEQEENKND
ncbi:MAG: PadR family transcriptional regulator [Clostridia bacterium]|nr:PadR family transcriptional regulator [Clostridia bacterium]